LRFLLRKHVKHLEHSFSGLEIYTTDLFEKNQDLYF
jgi:hypothetical protein